MTLFHVDASVINKGTRQGGAQGFAHYLTGHATRMQQYLEREGHGRDDLVVSGAGALPPWAKDGAHFFAMADRFERQGGVVARHYQITLPRELSPQGRLDLAEDIRTVFFARYPHVFAVHCPQARDGSGEHPHLHVMFSTRREDDPSARTPKEWFARAASDGQDPLTGGVRKDRHWDRKATLQGVRYETAVLINAALEREGRLEAVSAERLSVRDLQRRGLWYLPGATPEQRAAVMQRREALDADERRLEHEVNRLVWHTYKQREGLYDISREAMIDHCRDRFWAHDQSPARVAEREASLMRSLEREYARPSLEHHHEQARKREPLQLWVHDEDRAEGGVHWREADREVAR